VTAENLVVVPPNESAPLRVSASRRNGQMRVRVEGEVDLRTRSALAAGLEWFPDDGGPLILDMAGVGFIDSSGLSVLLAASAARPGPEPRVQIINPSPCVSRLLELTTLSEVFGL
jgi:anti-sigma B factor antagonist